MSNLKKNLVYVYSVNFINGLAGIAFIPLAVHYLGSEGYGIYSIFILLISYIYYVELGVSKYFTRSIAQSNNDIIKLKQNTQKMVGIYTRIAIFLIFLTLILMFIVPNFIFPTKNNFLISILVLFASIDYLLSIPTTIQTTYSIGRENFQKVSKFTLISGLSRHIFLILTVILTKSVIILIIATFLLKILNFFYAKKYLLKLPPGGWKPSFQKGDFRTILNQTLLISIAQFTQITILSLGTVLVNRSFTLTEVGIYTSVFDLATKVWFFSNSLGQVIFPRFSSMLKDDDARINLLNKIPFYNNLSFTFFHLLFLFAITTLTVLPNFLLIQDIILFYLVLYGVCINAHTNLSFEFLVADSKLKQILIVNVSTILIMIISFYLLLDKFNFYSTGLSWAISQLINSFAMDYYVLKNSIAKKRVQNFIINFSVISLLLLLINVFIK